jgi:hypothetical protein
MAKKIFGTGILALALVFGMTVVGCDDGSTNGGGGILTLTDVPSEYNGKYAWLKAGNDEVHLLGCQSFNNATGTVTCSLISNGTVSIPMWIFMDDEHLEGYSGNLSNARLEVSIGNSKNAGDSDLFYLTFGSVDFSNGNATKSWNNGNLNWYDDKEDWGLPGGYDEEDDWDLPDESW